MEEVLGALVTLPALTTGLVQDLPPGRCLWCMTSSCDNTWLSPGNISKHLPYQLTPLFIPCAGPVWKASHWVDIEWPSLPSILIAKATACHLPSSLISPWWMTTSRSYSAVSSLKKQTQTLRNSWSSSKIWPVKGTITTAQPLKGAEWHFPHGHHAAIPQSCPPPWWNQTTWRVAGCCLCYENTWKTWPFYVDSLLGTNCKSATHNLRFQWFKLPAYFQGSYFR